MNSMSVDRSVWFPWMRRALQLASLADGFTSPNPLVGAVILDPTGKLVGEGYHLQAGKPHAEIIALQQAGDKAKSGTLIVTLEPCCHHGLTPPCTEAVINSGIKKVIVALEDPDPRVSGSGLQRLREAGLEVIDDVLKAEAAYQNRAFIHRVRTGRPWGILKWAMSLDGRIALSNGLSKWISTKESRDWVHILRAQCDAVIVGGETLRRDDPLLTSRGKCNPEPLRVVITRTLNLPLEANLWDVDVARTLVAFEADSAKSRIDKIPQGIDRLPLKSLEPISLLENLAQRKNCNRILWECGPALAAMALKQKCVQELSIVLAPKILGGSPSMSPLNEIGVTSMDKALCIESTELKSYGSDWILNMLIPPLNSDDA